MIISGFFLMIIGFASFFIGIKNKNVILKNIAVAIVVLSFLMMAVPLFLLKNL